MEEEQLKQLYMSYCVGFFKNNFLPPKEADLDHYNMRLKREFRTYCDRAFGVNPLTLEFTTPETWRHWTWSAMQLALEL